MHTFTLPSGPEIELREMSGAEEELLTNQRLIREGESINQALKNCILRIDEDAEPSMQDVLDMLSGDRLFLLVKLRRISLGDDVTLSLHCPDPYCGEDNPVEINLEDLEVTPYPAEREFRFKLPKSEKEVVFIPLDGHMEKRLVALKNPGIHSAMLMRIKELGDKPPTRKTFLDLPALDLNALRAEMRAKDGGIDTVIKTSCLACGAVIQRRLEAEPAGCPGCHCVLRLFKRSPGCFDTAWVCPACTARASPRRPPSDRCLLPGLRRTALELWRRDGHARARPPPFCGDAGNSTRI